MRLTARIALALLFAVIAPPQAQAQETPSSSEQAPLDLQKLMGTWYVIARTPNPLERGHVASRDEYTLREDGKVGIRYVYREGFGEPEKETRARASVAEDSGNRDWRVWFYRIVPTRQRILEVAPDYSWMLLSWPGRDLAWVFARSPDMGTEQYRQLVAKLRDEYGIYTDKLQRVPQRPDQIDKLGFAAPKKL
ncbi:MAG: lipocalin family protein [Gammaproteobacteria bacterium]